MKKQRTEKKRRHVLPMWTYEKARAAVPYLAALARSLRENWLNTRCWRLRAERIEALTAQPKRKTLLALEEMRSEAQWAFLRYQDVARDLQRINVFFHDPVRGELFLPFNQGMLLAWFVFNPFAPDPLVGWRFHADPRSMRRPMSAVRVMTSPT